MEIVEQPALTKEQGVTFVYFELNFNSVSVHELSFVGDEN